MLKVGLIGCGFMGGMHSACYNVIEGVKIVAVADVRAEKAEAVARVHGAKIDSTGKELIEDADVDVIDICLPTYLHTEHAVLAMKKGRNVFIEKPVALTKEEGELLLATQKETGAKVQVGHVVRIRDEFVWLKEFADKKEYGEIRTAVFRRLSAPATGAWEGWLDDADKSGSMALDLHVHDVDFMRYLMGEPKSFTTAVDRSEDGTIQQIFTTFNYDKAVVTTEACLDYPLDFPFEFGFRVKFDKATVVCDKTKDVTVYYEDGGIYNPEIKPAYEGNCDMGGNISTLGAYYNELKYFVDRLNADEELTIAPLDEAVKSVNLVLDEIASVGGARLK